MLILVKKMLKLSYEYIQSGVHQQRQNAKDLR